LKSLLNSDRRYDQIVVVGHSLGSVIAYDALNRITQDINVPRGISQDAASRIKGLVTLGSPLDKVTFLFKERTPDRNLIQRGILANLHSFKKRKLKIDQQIMDIRDPFQKKLDVRWVNFYHLKDRIAGHLDAFTSVENVPCEETVPGIGPHSCYWQLKRDVYDKIIECFF